MHRRTFLHTAVAATGLLPLAARAAYARVQSGAAAIGDLEAICGDGRLVTIPVGHR